MFITAGTFNIVLQQASLFEIDEAEVFSVLGIDSSYSRKRLIKLIAALLVNISNTLQVKDIIHEWGLKWGLTFLCL